MLGHSLAILMTRYAHLARFARYALLATIAIFRGRRMRPLGFASLAPAARMMDDIFSPIPIDLRDLDK
jgi:hypothetical protein